MHNNSPSFTPALQLGVEILLLASLPHTSAPCYTPDTMQAAARLSSKLGEGKWAWDIVWASPFLQTLGW